jgi:AraC-like DNA-binding protein
VKATYQRTLSAMIEAIRLEKARAMLMSGCPVKVAALSFGYKQVSHFSRNFRNQFGLSPSKYVIQICLGPQPTASRTTDNFKSNE